MSDPFIVLWLLVLIGAVVVEAATVSMVSIWFAAGSLVAILLAKLGFGIYAQVIGFLIVSALLIAFIMPRVKKRFTGSRKSTNADRIIGAEGLVVAEIDEIAGTGQVKVLGNIWSAKAASGEKISEGARVIVKRIEGVKAVVEEKI